MRFNLPKTVHFLPFQDYDPEQKELAGVGIWVWVDPPRAELREYDRINAEFGELLRAESGKPAKKATILDLLKSRRLLGKKASAEAYRRAIHEWYAGLWSQGPADTHWTRAELATIDEQNPAFLEWMYRRTWRLIDEHRRDIKKGSRPPEQTPPAQDDRATTP